VVENHVRHRISELIHVTERMGGNAGKSSIYICPHYLTTAAIRRVFPTNSSLTKALVSSLGRSLFSGGIIVFKNDEHPLFRFERKQVDEVTVAPPEPSGPHLNYRDVNREFLFQLSTCVKAERRQWVFVSAAQSVAIRNIDHLVPPDLEGPFAPPECDFYWTALTTGKDQASPGLWAVRGEHLSLVLERWKEAWAAVGDEKPTETEIWSQVVRDLPLRKKRFEKGEVVAPGIGAVDWEAVSNAAFVTVPDWPEKEAWKFLQALYFGTYLGDETGMMLNILEA
jgi:hypothetical protein